MKSRRSRETTLVAVSARRTSRYSRERKTFLADDGIHYMVMEWDEALRREIPRNLYTVGEDGVTAYDLANLDLIDHEEDLNERYERENRDRFFSSDEADDPIDGIQDAMQDVHSLAFPEKKEHQSLMDEAREFMDSELTENQRNLVFDHLGAGLSLEEIRRMDESRTGERKSQQSYSNRKSKILKKAEKFFKPEAVKERK